MQYWFLSAVLTVGLTLLIGLGWDERREFVVAGLVSLGVIVLPVVLWIIVWRLRTIYRIHQNQAEIEQLRDLRAFGYMWAVSRIERNERTRQIRSAEWGTVLWALGVWVVFLLLLYWAGYFAEIGVAVRFLWWFR